MKLTGNGRLLAAVFALEIYEILGYRRLIYSCCRENITQENAVSKPKLLGFTFFMLPFNYDHRRTFSSMLE